ncbi:hypothetical protein D3C78_1665710 [compost metagenome]
MTPPIIVNAFTTIDFMTGNTKSNAANRASRTGLTKFQIAANASPTFPAIISIFGRMAAIAADTTGITSVAKKSKIFDRTGQSLEYK